MQHVELVWPSCCIMLYDVERSLISIKHFMQHRSTFLLFSCVNKKVALDWPRTSTLLHSRTCSESSLRQGQQVVLPKIRDHYSSQICNLNNSSLHHTTCWHSFRHAVQHHPTKLNLTMLNDVAFVWPKLKIIVEA